MNIKQKKISCEFLGALLFLLVFLLLATACGKAPEGYIDFRRSQAEQPKNEEVKEQRPLTIAVAAVISPQETIDGYRIIAERITKLTGHPTALIQRKTYEEINTLLSNGGADMAFISTGAYSAYRGMQEIDLLAMAELDENILYTTDIIVHADSDIQSFADLKGRTFAFTDPLSYSGHVAIENLLWQQNTSPGKFFKRYFYTYNHDKSIWAVSNRLVDAASIDSQIYEYALRHNPDLAKNIRIIESKNPSPTGPVVIRRALPEAQKKELQQIFLQLHQDPATAKAMQRLMIDRFVLPQPDLYLPLKEIYDRMSTRYENNA